MKRAIVLALVVSSIGCQDNEQRARAVGTESRDAVARRCAVDAGAPDDELAACTDQACRAACAERDVPRGFDRACLDACRQTAICATDEDCSPGKQCIAVAPVVRRCR